jgi:hypothetical protein
MELLAASTDENVPAGQPVHTDEPDALEYVPASQDKHTEELLAPS